MSEKNDQLKILTFGYGNRRDYDQFIDYLESYQVEYVVDVRIKPRAWSRKWYGQEIKNLCLSKNIDYISQTNLGNISGKAHWIPPDEKAAEIALEKVAELARNGTVLLLCAELDPRRCHRTEVADKLEKIVPLPVHHLK